MPVLYPALESARAMLMCWSGSRPGEDGVGMTRWAFVLAMHPVESGSALSGRRAWRANGRGRCPAQELHPGCTRPSMCGVEWLVDPNAPRSENPIVDKEDEDAGLSQNPPPPLSAAAGACNAADDSKVAIMMSVVRLHLLLVFFMIWGSLGSLGYVDVHRKHTRAACKVWGQKENNEGERQKMVVPSQPSTSAGDALGESQVPAPTEDTLPTQAASPSVPPPSPLPPPLLMRSPSVISKGASGLDLTAVVLWLGCAPPCVATATTERRRQLKPRYSTGSSNIRAGSDVASIGSPARDFVRLSSLPPATLRSDERGRRCMACDAPGDCVALRPCGHRVLCRKCSDFVHACPHCGQYISGVSHVPNASRSRAPPGLP